MIDEARLHRALTYLATTDEPCAEARADMERMEFKAKAVKDALFRRLSGSVADRQAEAGVVKGKLFESGPGHGGYVGRRIKDHVEKKRVCCDRQGFDLWAGAI
jgi:hypothetical protein